MSAPLESKSVANLQVPGSKKKPCVALDDTSKVVLPDMQNEGQQHATLNEASPATPSEDVFIMAQPIESPTVSIELHLVSEMPSSTASPHPPIRGPKCGQFP